MRDVQQLRDPKTGDRVVQSVYKREDLYHGPYVDRAPDIIVWCHGMYREGPFAQGPLIGEVPHDELVQVSGSHDEKGILLVKGPGISAGSRIEGARLLDVPPSVLHTMELPVPADMDGRVLTELFVEARDVETVELDLQRKTDENFLSDEEEQQIKDKLKGWGYL
jgi:predicted AlkP superfamily phosphohydrolase/phosphomutase